MKINNFNADERPSSLTEKFLSWSWISDGVERVSAARAGDYAWMVKNVAIAALKSRAVAMASYGLYRFVMPSTVYMNDYFKMAEEEVLKNGQNNQVPSSVVALTKELYEEQNRFSRWPTSGKEFFFEHLAANSVMSGAIVQYLLKEADTRGDSTMLRQVLKTCTTATKSSNSCLAALQTVTGSSEKGVVEGVIGTVRKWVTGFSDRECLDGAMSVVRKCRKSSNEFCSQGFEKATQLATKLASEDDLNALLGKMRGLTDAEKGKYKNFVETAIPSFEKRLESLEKSIEACAKADSSGVGALWETCRDQAGFIEKIALSVDEHGWYRRDYLQQKQDSLREDLKQLVVGNGVDLAKACALFKDSESCEKFGREMIDRLAALGEVKALEKLSSNSLEFLPRVLDSLVAKGQWEQGVSLVQRVLSKEVSPETLKQVEKFWDQCLASKQGSAVARLLLLWQNILMKLGLSKA
jgi:hypothetical protein